MGRKIPSTTRRNFIKTISAVPVTAVGAAAFSGNAVADSYWSSEDETYGTYHPYDEPNFPSTKNVYTSLKLTNKDTYSNYTNFDVQVATYGWVRDDGENPAAVDMPHESFMSDHTTSRGSELELQDLSVGACHGEVSSGDTVDGQRAGNILMEVGNFLIGELSEYAGRFLGLTTIADAIFEFTDTVERDGVRFFVPYSNGLEVSDFYHNMRFEITAAKGETGHIELDSGFGGARNIVDLSFTNNGRDIKLYDGGEGLTV